MAEASSPRVYRRAFYVVSTDEGKLERCCNAISEAMSDTGASRMYNSNFAAGITQADACLSEHSVVALESDECESYSEESMIMMDMIEKFRSLTSNYSKVTNELQSILWKYLPKHTQEFSSVNAPFRRVIDGKVGDFEAIEMIGHGKFGQIIACRNVLTGKRVVLKKMAKSYVKSLCTFKRVNCEIKLMRNEARAHLLPIDDVFQTNSHLYYTMEQYGMDLFDFMKLGNHAANGAGCENATIIFAHLCEALAFAHRQGYAHRDIKSENVLVKHERRPDGSCVIKGVKLIDFGLACAIDDEMTRGEACGSRGFMAPEAVIRRLHRPTLLDSWSLSCLMLEIIVGRTWFTQVWFRFFKEIADAEGGTDSGDIDFTPVQRNIDSGLDACQKAGTEPNVQLALYRMLVIPWQHRAEVCDVRDELRRAFDVPGGRFNGIGLALLPSMGVATTRGAPERMAATQNDAKQPGGRWGQPPPSFTDAHSSAQLPLLDMRKVRGATSLDDASRLRAISLSARGTPDSPKPQTEAALSPEDLARPATPPPIGSGVPARLVQSETERSDPNDPEKQLQREQRGVEATESSSGPRPVRHTAESNVSCISNMTDDEETLDSTTYSARRPAGTPGTAGRRSHAVTSRGHATPGAYSSPSVSSKASPTLSTRTVNTVEVGHRISGSGSDNGSRSDGRISKTNETDGDKEDVFNINCGSKLNIPAELAPGHAFDASALDLVDDKKGDMQTTGGAERRERNQRMDTAGNDRLHTPPSPTPPAYRNLSGTPTAGRNVLRGVGPNRQQS